MKKASKSREEKLQKTKPYKISALEPITVIHLLKSDGCETVAE